MIRIYGDKKFTDKTNKALALLRDKDAQGYEFVNKYVVSVVHYTRTKAHGINVHDGTFYVNTAASSTLYWYACSLVHEAAHRYLHLHKVEHGGGAAEMFCLAKQIESLERMGAPSYITEYARSCYNTDWYTNAGSVIF